MRIKRFLLLSLLMFVLVTLIATPTHANLPAQGKVHILLGNDPSAWQSNLSPAAPSDAGEMSVDEVIFSTYISGERGDPADAIAVDSAGNVYLAGTTNSQDYPLVEPYQNSFSCGDSSNNYVGYIAKLNPTGSTLLYATFFGGGCTDEIHGIAVDDEGYIYVTGTTYSRQFPVVNALYEVPNLGEPCDSKLSLCEPEAFVAKLTPDGSSLVFSTFFGGSEWEAGADLALDAVGNIYITGQTYSQDLPTVNGYQMTQPSPGTSSAYISKFNSDGTQLLYSSYLGGSSGDLGRDITVDAAGNIYVAGNTFSSDFPTENPAASAGSIFISKFNPAGSELIYSTYWGGSGASLMAIAVDGQENAYITGEVGDDDYPTTEGAFSSRLNGSDDAFVASFSMTGTVNYSTFLGGSGIDDAHDIAVDERGNAYVTGFTRSSDFPTEAPIQPAIGTGGGDAYVTALSQEGDKLRFSTFYGGSNVDWGTAIASHKRHIFVAGIAGGDFPTTEGAYQTETSCANCGNGFVARFYVENPLVFVHGISGGVLVDDNNQELWPGQVGNHDTLSLFPNDPQATNAEVERLLLKVDITEKLKYPVYAPLYDYLTEEADFQEYLVEGDLARQTAAGCDVANQSERYPNLFIFIYDWRKDNIENAAALADYIDCIQQFYPAQEVDILAHSMGGLLARRYLLDHPDDHDVNTFISVGSPWLGAPKVPYVMEFGDFVPFLEAEQATHILGSFKGAHQLMLSLPYLELGGLYPFGELGVDLDGDGNTQELELYGYDKLIAIMDTVYGKEGFTPGTTGDAFHTHPGQDDWRSEESEINYYHIVGKKPSPDTLARAVVRYGEHCKIVLAIPPKICEIGRYPGFIKLVDGDGTVPLLSATRQGKGLDLNAPQAKVHLFDQAENPLLLEHTGLLGNPEVQDRLMDMLENPASAAPLEPPPATRRQGAIPVHIVTVLGSQEIHLTDANGYTTAPGESDAEWQGVLPGIEILRPASDQLVTFLPSNQPFTVTLEVSHSPLFIEILTGDGLSPTHAMRYVDLGLPKGAMAELYFTPTGVSSLHYDSDGNGTLDMQMEPPINLTGADAADETPPTVELAVTEQGNEMVVTLSATDTETGADAIYYSLDGEGYQLYEQPFAVNPNAVSEVYAFADDQAGNRSVTVSHLFSPTKTQHAIYLPILTR